MDKYSLSARIYPIVIFLLPLVIIGVSYSIAYNKYLHILTTLGISSALLYFLSNLGRDNGKLKEPELWRKWGGMPTIQLLSFENKLIDEITKKKYHKKLLELSPIDRTIDFENSTINSVSDVYASWTKFLISRTRDTKKYSLLFKENISYGFRRNLWGLKSLSLIVLTITIFANYLFHAANIGFNNILQYPIQFFISESLLLALLLIWVFRINSNWIKIPAFGYAESLLESIETM